MMLVKKEKKKNEETARRGRIVDRRHYKRIMEVAWMKGAVVM